MQEVGWDPNFITLNRRKHPLKPCSHLLEFQEQPKMIPLRLVSLLVNNPF